MKIEDFIIIAIMIAIILAVMVFIGLAVYAGVQESKFEQAFRDGKVSLEEFCLEKTGGGVTQSVPVACYQYFGVHQEGTKQVCAYNVALKMPTCKTEPILEPDYPTKK